MSYINELFNKLQYITKNKCIEWKGNKNKDGYGLVWFNKKLHYTHRLAFQLHYGNFNKNLCVLHKCDNPYCFNPLHLFLGTHADNVKDKTIKGRTPHSEFHANSKLNCKKIIKIRQLYSTNKYSQQELAYKFCVSRQSISFIVNNTRWKYC